MSLFDNDVLDNLYEQNIPFTNSRDDFIETLLNCAVLNRIDGEISPEREKMFTYIMDTARLAKAEDVVLETVEQMEKSGSLAFWELPKPFEKQVPMQKFNPDSCLPDLLRDYLKAVVDFVQVEPEMAVLPLLSVLSLCVQGKAVIKNIGNSHTEPLNLYTITVASPGERKSGSLKEFMRPVEEFQKNYNRIHAMDFTEYKAKKSFLEAQKRKVSEGKNADINKAVDFARQLEELEQQTEHKSEMLLNVSDVTPEALAWAMGGQLERMGIIDSEGTVFDVLSGIYSNGLPNINIFLQAYDGSPYTVIRCTKGIIELENPLLAIGLMTQYDHFREAMNNKQFSGRGFIHRFLFAFPESRVGHLEIAGPDIPPNIQQSYNNLINRLLRLPENVSVPVIQCGKEATRLFEDYHYLLQDKMKDGGMFEHLKEWGSKHFARTLRIAGILHLCEYKPTEQVTGDTAMKAVSISLWAENQAFRAFSGTAFEDETTRNAKRILKKLKEKRQDVYTRSEISRDNRTIKSDELDEVLELLDDMKYIRIIEERTKTNKKIIIKVNPLIFDK